MIQLVFLAVLALIVAGAILLLRKDKTPESNGGSSGGSDRKEHEKSDGHEKVDDKDHDQDRMED